MSTHEEDIGAVICYLEEDMDVPVVFDRDEPNAYWHNGHGTVSVSTKQTKRLQLYSLLHEAGHAIIREKEDYDVRLPYGKLHKNKSISRRIDVLREEVLAWECGRELAYDLGINLDNRLWHNFVKKNLFDYVRWVNDPSIFERQK